MPELHRQRLVEAVLLTDRGERFRRTVLTGQRQGWVTRERTHPEEHHHRRQEQRDK